MPRMKPIEPWFSLYRQTVKALRDASDLTTEELEQALIVRNALYVLAYNRERSKFAVETFREILAKERS